MDTVRTVAQEVEAKLAAPPGFVVPPLDEAVPGLRAEGEAPVTLLATYFDAPDLRLTRAGISLRHRNGTWTLKTGANAVDGVLRRDELEVDGDLRTVPPAFLARLRPWLRTAELEAVAQLDTVRARTVLRLEGEVVGEVDDDEVTIPAVGDGFREIEVESSDESVLAAVVARLRAAGAGAPDPTPKLVRAIGPQATAPPDVAVGDVDRHSPAVDVLRSAMAAAVQRIVVHDAVVRDGDDTEGIHQMRVGCRRLRSDLRTFAPLLPDGWAEPLRDEVRWLAGELGIARDLDVLCKRLVRQGAPAGILGRVDRERAEGRRRAVAALDDRRYVVLLDRLVDAIADLPCTAAGQRPAKEVVPSLAGAAFAKLRRGARRAGPDAPDEELHGLRIKAKRARYAADVAIPVVGKAAVRYTKRLGRLQDVLGDLHDCSVAEAWLTACAPSATKAEAFELGVLVAEQRHEAARLRRRWRKRWRDVDKDKVTAWMR